MLKLKVISTASSKKGKKYLSVEIVEGDFPMTGEVLHVNDIPNEKGVTLKKEEPSSKEV